MNKRGKFSISSLIITLMFVVNICLIIIGITVSGMGVMLEAPVGSTNGLMIGVYFVIACICSIPQILGAILSISNLFFKKKILLAFIFIVSLISVIAIIFYQSTAISLKGFAFNMILSISISISISIIALVKMILRN